MSEKRTVLGGDDAVALWKQRRDAWNAWVDEHPEADIDFDNVEFGPHAPENGRIDFSGYRFPNGDVSFDGAQFGDGDVLFTGAQFGKGYVWFRDAKFGNGDISFWGAQFGDGDVWFSDAKFGDGVVSFFGAQFGDGNVWFGGAKFGDGNVSFNDAQFGDGNVWFDDAQFGKGDVSFDGASINGPMHFSPKEFKGDLSFRTARFDDVLILEGNYSSPPDLRSTTTKGHVDLHDLTIEKATKGQSNTERQTRAKFGRLKELAEGNRHHDAALRFFAEERRALKRSGDLGKGALFETIYDGLCDYGQSIGRPSLFLLGNFILFIIVYFGIAVLETNSEIDRNYIFCLLANSFFASFSNVIPFLSKAFEFQPDIFADLFGEPIPLTVDLARFVQGVISLLLLFLIGLGLRNRFRI